MSELVTGTYFEVLGVDAAPAAAATSSSPQTTPTPARVVVLHHGL